MIVDTSALIAVAMGEPDAAPAFDAMIGAPVLRISAGSLLEAAIVADRRGPVVARRLDQLVRDLRAQVVPVDLEQVTVARAAYRDFGKGSGHPAQLNSGDCFSYALATVTGESLLWVGEDFGHTDVEPALPAL